MSRSGYSYDYEHLDLYRASVDRALRGRRGQKFLRELAEAMDAMPEKRLITRDLERGGDVCTLGVVGRERGIDMDRIDQDDPEHVGQAFGIARSMAAEIEDVTDDTGPASETPEQRWVRVRRWVALHLTSGGER